ncbi:MAG: hypothetical protein U9Q92_00770 [archaeon]|nr:hypothetical protein [archaeon]
MKIKVVCPKCEGVFDWTWGKQKGVCECCDAHLNIREVKLAQGEVMKLFQ